MSVKTVQSRLEIHFHIPIWPLLLPLLHSAPQHLSCLEWGEVAIIKVRLLPSGFCIDLLGLVLKRTTFLEVLLRSMLKNSTGTVSGEELLPHRLALRHFVRLRSLFRLFCH